MAQPKGDLLMPVPNAAIAARLIADVAEEASLALERRGGSRNELRTTPTDAASIVRGADFLDWAQPFSLAPGAAVWMGAQEQEWTAIGGVASPSSDGEPTSREEWVRFVSRILSAVAERVAGRLGVSVEAGSGNEAGCDPGDILYRAEIDLPAGPASFFVGLSPELLQAIADLSSAAAGGASPASMDLLLDVELPVSVSFGRTFLPVRDVLRLATGSVVELNRHVDDYVDVIVNNCVIARGEVVVIEGNYGIRVHEIVSRRERAMLQHVGRSAPTKSDMKVSA